MRAKHAIVQSRDQLFLFLDFWDLSFLVLTGDSVAK
jgi:hypothetical protein